MKKLLTQKMLKLMAVTPGCSCLFPLQEQESDQSERVSAEGLVARVVSVEGWKGFLLTEAAKTVFLRIQCGRG